MLPLPLVTAPIARLALTPQLQAPERAHFALLVNSPMSLVQLRARTRAQWVLIPL